MLGLTAAPAWTAVHRWTFAKPASPREEPYGLVGRVGACGDGWSAPSRVQSAWSSGDALGSALADLLALTPGSEGPGPATELSAR